MPICIDSLTLFFSCIDSLSSSIFWIKSADYLQQIYVSPSYEKIYGNRCDALYQYPNVWADNIMQDGRELTLLQFNTRLQNQLNNKIDTKAILYKIQRTDGAIHFLKNQTVPLKSTEGNILAFCGVTESISQCEWEATVLGKIKFSSTNNLLLIKDLHQMLSTSLEERSKKTPTLSHQLRLTALPKQSNIPYFTSREQDCIHLLLNGKSAKETGAILQLSHRTVESHLFNIKKKLNCRTKLEVISKLQNIPLTNEISNESVFL